MSYRVLKEPTAEEAKESIGKGVDRGHVICVVGRCEVDYEGRTSSFLPAGDRIIMRKPDGNFLVHTDENRKPANWQPTGSSFDMRIEDELLILNAENNSPEEIINVTFDDLYTVSTYAMLDDHSIEKFGTEDNIQEHLFENPESIEYGFRSIEREWKMDVGSVDIFGYDKDSNPVIVEVKRRKSGPDAVQQLRRYVESFEQESGEEDVRGILIAPELTDSARSQVSKYNFKHVKTPDETYGTSRNAELSDFR